MIQPTRYLQGMIANVIVLADPADEIGRHGRSLPDAEGTLPQPVDSQELLGRLSQILAPPERAGDKAATAREILHFEGRILDLAGRAFLDADGQEVLLTHAEFRLLATFIRRPGRILSRDRLRNAVTGRGSEPYDRSIDMLVARLRRKIEPNPKAPRFILTVPNEGYKFAVRPKRAETGTTISRPIEPLRNALAEPINNLPYPSLGTLFKGRDRFLLSLRESLMRVGGGRTAIVSTALYGLGGVGKTRMAVEYAHAHRANYKALLFAIGDSPEALRHNLAALVGPMALNLPQQHEAEHEIRLKAVLTWLNAHPGWLLILDNLDVKEAMAEAHRLMARIGGGHVVITSRLASFAPEIEALQLDVLTTDDAAEFLLQRTERHRLKTADDEAAARDLSSDLGQLALALEQAGAYIDKRQLSFTQYRALWRENWTRVAGWADESITHYPRAVAVAWQTSVDQLKKNSRNAALRLLARLSWLALEPVPYFLLEIPLPEDSIGRREVKGQPQDSTQDQFEALDDLAGLSLVRRDSENSEFRVHRLVQDVTRRGLTDEMRRSSLIETLRWIIDGFKGNPEGLKTRSRLDRIALHARVVMDHAVSAEIGEPTSALMNQLGEYAVSKALYADARPLLEQALANRETLLGPWHPDTATSLCNLGGLLLAQGDLVQAQALCERALAIREKVLGIEHPDTADILNNLLAGLVRAQGDLSKARALCERALAIREKALGPLHVDTARSLNDLASVLRDQGDLASARRLCARALAIRENVLGFEHVDTARSLTSLGLLLEAGGDACGARPFHERALAIREKVFGPEHPLTARSLSNLGSVLRAQGDVAGARGLWERALTIRETVLGCEHPDAVNVRNKLKALSS
jgi:DNA-binding response OmpR family regulator/tetratricopeptide (TPR) repeat protein